MKVLLFDRFTRGHHLEYAGHLARFLAESGDEVIFATWALAQDEVPESLEQADIRTLNTRGWISRGPTLVTMAIAAYRCLKLAAEEKVDVVHYLYLERSELALAATLLIRRKRTRLFGTMFWPYFIIGETDTVGPAKRLFYRGSRAALRRLLSGGRLDCLFVHSERIAQLLVENRVDPSSGRVRVVPDPAKAAPPITVEEARIAMDLPLGTPIVLFFGGTRPDKGPDVLLDALPLVRGQWLAVLAGEPDLVGEEEAEACRRDLSDPGRLVTRFGFVPEADADRYFRAADVIVLPYTRAFKGTTNVLRRAAASGKPVIVSDVADVGYPVREAGLGIVVPPESPEALADAINRFLATREELTREVEPRALAFAGANDWRILGESTRDAYLAAATRLHP